MRLDVTGQTFNWLTAIEFSHTNKRNVSYWKFICKCGEFITTRLNSVKVGDTKSCGCARMKLAEKNEIGKKYGYLTVLKRINQFFDYKDGSRRSIFLFKCICGKKCKFTLNEAKQRNNTISCGCRSRKFTEKSAFKILFNQYKTSARERKLSFNISFINFKKLVQKPCYYCKDDPPIRKKKAFKGKIKAHGLDRINSNIGYSIKNCVCCCKKCNYMKSNMTTNEFFEQIEKIKNNSCGSDNNTRTIYVSEKNTGDTTKVMLLCVYDLIEKFNLQKTEVLALFKDLLNNHITEVDELTGKETIV